MAYQVRGRDMEIALRHLQEIVDRTPVDQHSAKVYYEGPNSYSWSELMSEVKGMTNFGRRWVGTLVSAAQHENQDLERYLKGSTK